MKTSSAKSSSRKTAVRAKPDSEQAIAARWMQSLTLREKVAQLIVIPFSGHPMNTRTREYHKFVALMTRERVGGLVLINVPNGRPGAKADPLEVASFLNRMQGLAKVPLLVAGDFERGVSMRVDSTTVFPHAMAFTAAGDAGLERREGE
ncbi:MAG: glycoside hydrolase family 3 N-terminal domain-containing protein, partial [Acidobacteriota bacterium]